MTHWGIGLPAHLPGATRPDILEYARRAEALGFDSLWVGDRIVYSNLDVFATLAAAAAVTKKVLLSPTTVIAPARPPLELAKAFATLDVLSDGRVRAVYSVGHRQDDYAATGAEFESRGARLLEAVEIARLAWSGKPVRYRGRHYQLDVGPVGPPPTRAEGIPLWLAGDSAPARFRAVKVGDGHVSGTAGREMTRRLRADFDRLCEESGRDPSSLPLAATAFFTLGPDPRAALEQGMRNLLPYYGTLHWDPETDVIWGNTEEAAQRVVEYGAGTLTTFVFVATSFALDGLERLRHVVSLVERMNPGSSVLPG
jgi:alkanesulfonate monooxygenase SsuD/methylene tetrahydromethanopterin reductase-like flavin-dependent oxidoreductase (luciferase family)